MAESNFKQTVVAWRRVLLGKVIASQLVNKFPFSHLWDLQIQEYYFKRLPLDTVLSQMNSVHA
jgi:hypothetical protein